MLLTSQGAVDLTYRATMRRHRHRCRCCNRIILPGERVVMARVTQKRISGGTFAVHAACADRPHSAGSTWRAMLAQWAHEASGGRR